MSGQLVDLVVVVAALAILVYFVFIQPAARRAERTARLSALAAVLEGGHLQAGHIHGSHAGYAVEAWPLKAAVGTSGSAAVMGDRLIPGDTFTIQFSAIAGERFWRAGTHVSLNPFVGTPSLQLTTAWPADARGILKGIASRVTGLSAEPDPDLEERLRAAGLMDQIARLQAGSRYLHLEFVPSAESLAEHSMQRLPGFSGFSPEVADHLRSMSRLGCTLQAHGGLGPTPPTFAEQLEILVRIVRINAQVNRAPEAHQFAVPPARTNNHDVARAVLGAWSNQLLAMTFEVDGTLSMVMKLGRHTQTGRWALDGDGRVQLSGEEGLRATAWVEGQALTVLLPRGMTVRLQRG